jgi:hypothetical protein
MPNVVMFPLAVYTRSSQASRKSFPYQANYGAQTFHNIPLTQVSGIFGPYGFLTYFVCLYSEGHLDVL